MSVNRIILGSGRSGTTWVVDALAEANRAAVLFEPLHPVMGEVAARFAGCYLPPGTRAEELRALLSAAPVDTAVPDWTAYRTLPDRVRFPAAALWNPRRLRAWWRRRTRYQANRDRYGVSASQTVVKLIRGNLLYDWLIAQPSTRVVSVVRHPGAVVESRMRLDRAARAAGLADGIDDWDPDPALRRFLADDALLAVGFEGVDLGGLAEGPEAARHAAVWCFENRALMQRLTAGEEPAGSFSVRYETLVTDPGAWRAMAACLQLGEVPDAARQARPSQQASADFTGAARHERWRDRLEAPARRDVDAVLARFGIAGYRCDADDAPTSATPPPPAAATPGRGS